MKFRLSILLFILLPFTATVQTYIKTNALYWLGGLPNVQVETRLTSNLTFEGEINASLWESIKDRPFMGAGVRYYIKTAFKGFYVGGDAAFDCYNVSKWDHWENPSVQGGIDIQHGVGLYLGVTLGYQLLFARRWNLDFYAGGGWASWVVLGRNETPRRKLSDVCRVEQIRRVDPVQDRSRVWLQTYLR